MNAKFTGTTWFTEEGCENSWGRNSVSGRKG